MLRSIKALENYSIGATDGVIGRMRDFYFDDEAWVIRYLVVQADPSFSNRKVLISPFSILQPNWLEEIFPVSITQAQVRNSPDIDTDKPVSRQHEMGYLGYYGYPNYWGGGGLWGGGIYPDMLQAGLANVAAESRAKDHKPEDHHLRSANGVLRYYVHAADGDIGHVQDLLVEEKTWAIRYIIVNTSNWWLGHEVVIAPEWINDISWAESKVDVALTRQAVKNSPAYDSAIPLDRELETGLYKHFGRDGYWERNARREDAVLRR